MSYNAALLRALAGGEPVSGEALGRALGTSRAAVWKGIRRLRALGLEVEARAGRGYRLAAPLELLDAARIRAGLPAAAATRIGRLEVMAETASTNARVLAAEEAPGELVACLAEYQSAGRGRRGRRWLAAPGSGICLSVGGRLPASPAAYAGLSTAVGVALASALEREGAGPIGLKWPNDLLLGGGKLGGVLIELRGEAQGPVTIAVGVGLNVQLGAAMRAEIEAAGGWPPAELAQAAAESGAPMPDRNRLAAVLVAALAGCLAGEPCAAESGLGRAVLEGWRARDALRDRPVRVSDAGGQPGAALAGIARGVDASGALVVETSDGARHRITAGEATLRMNG